MNKLFFGLTLFIVLTIGGIYGVLFTSPGNSFVASIIEDKVNEGQDQVSMKVNDFKLTMSDVLFKATIDENSEINVEGALNIFAKTMDLKYDVNIKDLAKLQNITKQKLNGSFSTKGTVKGDAKLAVLKGDSKVASGTTTYDVKLVDFQPSTIVYAMKDAKIEELLYLVNQPVYANGLLNIDANIKNANPETLDGDVVTTITNGIVNAKVINKELKEDPKEAITFTTKTTSKLVSNLVDTKVEVDSSVAKVDVQKASFNTKETSLNSDYTVLVKDLSKLEQILNKKYNGSFSTDGTIVMEDGEIKVDGKSDVAKSETTYAIKVKDAKPQITADILNAKIEELLHMLNMPIYASGLVNVDADITSADVTNLDGKVLTKITEGLVNNKVVNKEFEQKLKKPLNFKGDVVTNLEGTQAISDVDVDTTVANLDMEKVVYDLSTLTLTSDYTVDVADLSKLQDVTGQKMRGAVKLGGNLKQNAETLSVDGATKLFGGAVNFNLLNDNFKAKIDGVEIKDLLHMMYYPEIFTSKSNIDVDYNLAEKLGKVGGNLINGQFIKNEFSTIVNTFARFDLTKEIYEKVELKSDIKENIINTFVDMKSKHTVIKVPSSTLDTQKKYINALVQAQILKYNFDTTIKGNLNKPKVKVDTKAFMKNKIKDQIKKKLNIDLGNFLNKAPKEKTPEPVQKPASNAEIAEAFKKMFGSN